MRGALSNSLHSVKPTVLPTTAHATSSLSLSLSLSLSPSLSFSRIWLASTRTFSFLCDTLSSCPLSLSHTFSLSALFISLFFLDIERESQWELSTIAQSSNTQCCKSLVGDSDDDDDDVKWRQRRWQELQRAKSKSSRQIFFQARLDQHRSRVCAQVSSSSGFDPNVTSTSDEMRFFSWQKMKKWNLRRRKVVAVVVVVLVRWQLQIWRCEFTRYQF